MMTDDANGDEFDDDIERGSGNGNDPDERSGDQPKMIEGVKPEMLGTGTASAEKVAATAEAMTHNLTPVQPQVERENVAASGGAVASVVLGIWAIVGSFLTSWSVINAILGLFLGTWGLSSPKRRLSLFGMFLSSVGVLFCVVVVSQMVGEYFQTLQPEEPEF